jgi:ElaB/YqjD/DUF883 family membrane-anchored ribosome-binding protein
VLSRKVGKIGGLIDQWVTLGISNFFQQFGVCILDAATDRQQVSSPDFTHWSFSMNFSDGIALTALLFSGLALWQAYSFRGSDITIALKKEIESTKIQLDQLMNEPDRLTAEWMAVLSVRGLSNSGAEISRRSKHQALRERIEALQSEIDGLAKMAADLNRKTAPDAVVRSHSIRTRADFLQADIQSDIDELERNRAQYREAVARQPAPRT